MKNFSPRKRTAFIVVFIVAIIITVLSSNVLNDRTNKVASYNQNYLGDKYKPILSIAWHPNGIWLAASNDIGEITVWDIQKSLPVFTLHPSSTPVRFLAWNRDGSQLASIDFDASVILWNANTRKPMRQFKVDKNATGEVRWNADETRVIVEEKSPYIGMIQVWSAETNELFGTFPSHANKVANRVNVDSAGQNLAFTNQLDLLEIHDVQLPVKIDLPGVGNYPEPLQGDVKWSPDNHFIAYTMNDFAVQITDSKTQKISLRLQGHTDDISKLIWDTKGTRLMSISIDNTIRIWNALTGDLLFTLSVPSNMYFLGTDEFLAWDSEKDILASVGGYYDSTPSHIPSDRNRLFLWDTHNGQLVKILNIDFPASLVSLSPYSNNLAIAGDDGIGIYGAEIFKR